ncbi:AraC family transcriptional regulator [Liquorilactobacillus vini]|uniref:Sucrose operon repressor n=1 Tax=Liquorilactobacillus vini DSM 20605 TaxID=1133569 RepID=A0A0R2CBB8_9LACO|nr:AraC family transcriptional regulator [Liquorilactobacillus vini]KRM89135.1 sucrose operon repressor [Liquorilactobacillus vini DSM 20605]
MFKTEGFYAFNNPNYNPYLYLSSGGIDQTKPRHVYGPAGRSGYMIHYVKSGIGYFTSNNKVYRLKAGAFFFIEPGKIIKMKADAQDPWTLQWIRFTGKLAGIYMRRINISYQDPIFFVSNQHAQIILDNLLEILELSHMDHENDFIFESKLLAILDQLAIMYPQAKIKNKNTPNKIFTQGIQFIHNNFETPITIENVVDYLSVDRTYLFKLFKKELGISPQKYLIKCRIRKARQLLSTTDNPINVVANSCGYVNSLHFSRSFKHYTNLSPSQYRQQYRQPPQ